MRIEASKGQISMFVVVSAILVLVLVFLTISNLDSITVFSDDKSSSKVKEFIQSCMEIESKEAVRKVGLSGGWLYSPPLTLTDRDKPEEFNQRAKGLHFLEKVEMPYWYYYDDGSENFIFNIPEYDSNNIYSIKSQIKRYVTENIEECLDGFSSFDVVYQTNYDREETQIEVTMEKDEIIVEMYLPVEIIDKATASTDFINTYKIKVDNKIWVPYNLAKDITLAESESSFIETRILNFLNPYQTATTRELLPPFYDFRMTYDFQPWDLLTVETLIRQITNTHISKLQFLNTDYETKELPENLQRFEFARALNELYTKDYLTEHSLTKEFEPRTFDQFQNYKVKPSYELFYPSLIDIAPGMGGQILLPRPQAVIDLIPFFFTEYVAVYEITMPIVFEIRSNDPNDKFVFNLAIEANIDHNKPLAQNREFNLDLEALNLQANNALICDPPHFISEYVYLNITDPINKGERNPNEGPNGVDNALITFDCKGIASCFVGETSINEYDDRNVTELKFRLPLNCGPGTLEVYKYGHRTLTFDNLNPTPTQEIVLGEVEMPSEKKLGVEINILTSSSSQYAEGRDINDNEVAFIILENKEDKNVVKVIELNPDNQNDLSIEVMPGNYSVSGFLIYEGDITIPSEQICYKKGLFSGKDCQTLPEITLESWVSGGIEIDNYEIESRRIVNSEKIVINMVDTGIPFSYDSLRENSETINQLDLVSTGKHPYLE